MAMLKALDDPVLGRFEIDEGGLVTIIQSAKACFQVPVPGQAIILVGEVGQDCHKSLLLVEDQ